MTQLIGFQCPKVVYAVRIVLIKQLWNVLRTCFSPKTSLSALSKQTEIPWCENGYGCPFLALSWVLQWVL